VKHRANIETESIADTSDRPREKLVRHGARALGETELLALVIGHGSEGRSAFDLATTILREVGGVHGLTRVTPARLTRLRGLGGAKASRVLAAIELGRRTLCVVPRPRMPLRSPEELGQFLLPRFGAFPVERFGVVLLDARHRLLAVHLVSEGAVDATLAIPRDVFREATFVGASAVVAFHNHPSGDPWPSPSDIELTRRLMDAGRIVGIEVVDHLILADTDFVSMRKAELV
jgi:DNA repair protein RadC